MIPVFGHREVTVILYIYKIYPDLWDTPISVKPILCMYRYKLYMKKKLEMPSNSKISEAYHPQDRERFQNSSWMHPARSHQQSFHLHIEICTTWRSVAEAHMGRRAVWSGSLKKNHWNFDPMSSIAIAILVAIVYMSISFYTFLCVDESKPYSTTFYHILREMNIDQSQLFEGSFADLLLCLHFCSTRTTILTQSSRPNDR